MEQGMYILTRCLDYSENYIWTFWGVERAMCVCFLFALDSFMQFKLPRAYYESKADRNY